MLREYARTFARVAPTPSPSARCSTARDAAGLLSGPAGRLLRLRGGRRDPRCRAHRDRDRAARGRCCGCRSRARPTAGPFLRNHDQSRTLTCSRATGPGRSWPRACSSRCRDPFVYYGEEIGMTGDKPDPRIRTPMHWSRRPGGRLHHGHAVGAAAAGLAHRQRRGHGGRPGLAAQPVPAADPSTAPRTPRSGAGELIPLDPGTEAVAAYLRRKGDRVALVVANLGATPLPSVALSSDAPVLPAGRYMPTALLGRDPARPLEVGADGRLRGYVPIPELAPLQTYIFDIPSPISRRSREVDPQRRHARHEQDGQHAVLTQPR